MLLLCALVVGSVNAWAVETTITYTFTAKDWKATPADWISGKAGGGFNNNGIQVTSAEAQTGANGTSPRSFNSISKIVVTYNTNKSAGAGSIVAQVGTNDEKTNEVEFSGTEDGRSANFTTTFNYDPTQTGAVKITVNTTTNSIYLCSVAITYDETLTTTSMSFPQAIYTNILGEEFTEPVLACNSDGTVTYSSNNTAVAEVNSSTGALTIKKAGNATITASVPATANYTAGSASYTLKVQGPIVDGVFDFAINQNYGSGVEPSSTQTTESSTWEAGNVTMVVAGRYVWWSADNTLRLYDNNAEEGNPSNAGNITLSVPSGYFITKIDAQGGGNLTANVGYKSGTTWSGKSKSVTLTFGGTSTIKLSKITVTYCTETEFNTKVNITMGSDGYMTYCNQDAAVSFGTLEAYVVSAVGDDNVSLTPITKAPAGCAVVLKGTAGSYQLTKVETPDAVTSNRLRVSNGTTTSNDSYDVYALANGANGIGFYHVQAGVQVPAGKCYISVNKSSSARDFLGFGEETTAITGVNGNVNENQEVYDLSGRRVAQPTKGLYIVNGKKVIIK